MSLVELLRAARIVLPLDRCPVLPVATLGLEVLPLAPDHCHWKTLPLPLEVLLLGGGGGGLPSWNHKKP